jgi:hypothetical protein
MEKGNLVKLSLKWEDKGEWWGFEFKCDVFVILEEPL